MALLCNIDVITSVLFIIGNAINFKEKCPTKKNKQIAKENRRMLDKYVDTQNIN